MRSLSRNVLVLAGLVAIGVICIGAVIAIVHRNRASEDARTALRTAALPGACFGRPRTYASGARGSDSLVVLDLDGDGHPDLASPDLDRNFVSVARNSGGGGFEHAAVFRTGKRPYVLAAGDLNGDSSADLVTANVNSGTVSVLLNEGGGSFGHRKEYRVGQVPDSVVIGDIDSDGSADVFVTNQVGPSYASLLLNTGNGTFRRGPALSVQHVDAIADLNSDGKLDLVSLGEKTASVLLGLGGGRFASAVPYPTGDGPTQAAVGDVNGDRAVDLVTPNYGKEPMGVGNSVSVLINKGDGTFKPTRDFIAGEYPTSVAIGDVTGDTKPDLVSVDAESGDVSVLKNDGQAGFGERLTYRYEVGGGSESASIADTNGDGEGDLVVNRGGNAAVLLNVPGPCRESGIIEPAPESPSR